MEEGLNKNCSRTSKQNILVCNFLLICVDTVVASISIRSRMEIKEFQNNLLLVINMFSKLRNLFRGCFLWTYKVKLFNRSLFLVSPINKRFHCRKDPHKNTWDSIRKHNLSPVARESVRNRISINEARSSQAKLTSNGLQGNRM